MKAHYNIFYLVIGILGLFACSDEEIIKGGEFVEEGLPTLISLPFAPEIRQQIETRAEGEGNLVKDLYVFIFDEQGEKVTGRYFSPATIAENTNGTIQLSTTTGRRYIYGIANLSTNDLKIQVTDLNAISNYAELEALSVELESESIRFLGGDEFMSGFYGRNSNAEEAPVCIIRDNGSVDEADVTTTGTSKLWLKRLQSKITFDVGLSDNEDRLATSFVLNSYDVVNIPKQSALIETFGNSSASVYFDKENQTIFNEGKNNFTFYMLENKLSSKNGITIYDDREKKNDKGEWLNAPDQGTYVVLKGHYKGKAIKYTEKDNQRVPITDEKGNKVYYEVDADVTYYIHLGYVGNDASDFSSKRNKDYTYRVKIFGVDQIVLEVETDDPEDRADGEIYYADGENIIEVDAHYSSKVLSFTREQLGKEELEFKILVNSNKTSGFEEKDTDWLTFVKNPEGITTPVCYPGKGSFHLLNTNGFVKDLQQFRDVPNGNPKEIIYYTCFIQEYYDTDDNWKEYVNQADRIAQIICNAHSGNGSHTIDAAYIIRQKSIQTFYNYNNVESAWGLEWINETTETKHINTRVDSNDPIEVGLPYGTIRGTDENDEYNGRWNMINEIGTNASWYVGDFVPNQNNIASVDYHNALQKAYAACMQRNRDEDGNGKITADEVKWYLPAIYQYLDISIGANVLPERIQLYTTDDYNTKFFEGGKYYWMFKHFISNTNKKVYWAEEGGPYGAFGGNGDGKISHNVAVDNGQRQFRCLRNLGKNSSGSLSDANDKPQDFAQYTNNVMDLTKMNPKALRNDFYNQGELGRHSERDYLSRPYTKFRIAKDVLKDDKYVPASGGAYSKCENGYYPVGEKKGDHKKSTAYYTRQNGKERFFKVDAGLGDYMAFTDRKKVDNAYYYNTGSSAIGRYKYDNNKFVMATSSTTNLSGYTWIKSYSRRYNYGENLPDFYSWSNGDYKEGSPSKTYLYFYVGTKQGNFEYCGHSSTTYHYVGEGNGNHNISLEGAEAKNYQWCTQNQQADKSHTSVCSEYTEEPDGSDRGKWRLPNLRELLLIDSREKTKNLMSRTYYSFYLKDITENGYQQNGNGTLSDYSIYSPGDSESRQGFASNKSLVYLIKPEVSSMNIRCVKDVQ